MSRITRYLRPVLALLFAAIALIPTHTTHAATFTAGNATELINAITTANGNGEADTITLTADITLTAVDNTTDGANGLPSITSDITIEGAGFTIARGGGAPAFRIFHVAAGGNLTLNDVTISNGNANSGGSGDNGGGIYNRGTLTVSNSILSGNSASYYGGGIYSITGATLTVSNSILSGNSADIDGGGIHNAGTLTVSNSTLSGNSAASWNGGGIHNNEGTATVINSTLSGNSARFGGGICNMNTGTVTVSNSTLSGNSADESGGGIYNRGSGPLTVSNSTLSGNSGNFGGGIFNADTATLNNSTLTGNSAISWGGGIYNADTATLNNSIIANSIGGDCRVSSGGNFAGANNLAADDCAGISLGTVSNLDPVLADNGGPTWTHVLLAGSNAIDASGAGATAFDQRGVAAVGTRDIGAYEFGVSIPQLSFVVDAPAIFENGAAGTTVATVTVTLDNTAGTMTAGTIVVDFAFTGTATEGPTVGDDFQVSGLLLNFTAGTWPAPGTMATQSFTLTAWDDATAEGLETIDLTMSFTGPATLVGPNASTVLVIDDDTAPASATCPTCGVTTDPQYITKTVDNPMATGGQTVTYTITARNPKDVPLTQVVIYDVFDDRLENVRLVSTSHGFGAFDGDTLTVSGFTLQPGESATVVVSAQITAAFRAGDVIPNAAILESPDASVHVSNLVLVGDNCLSNDGEAVTLLVVPGQLPATGEIPVREWRQLLVP